MPDFQRVDRPVMAPSHCIFCSGDRGPLVDTLVSLEGGIGRLYVCYPCGATIADRLGFVHGSLLEQEAALALQLATENTDLQARADRLARLEHELAAVASSVAA
jgi:hypothetical protein